MVAARIGMGTGSRPLNRPAPADSFVLRQRLVFARSGSARLWARPDGVASVRSELALRPGGDQHGGHRRPDELLGESRRLHGKKLFLMTALKPFCGAWPCRARRYQGEITVVFGKAPRAFRSGASGHLRHHRGAYVGIRKKRGTEVSSGKR